MVATEEGIAKRLKNLKKPWPKGTSGNIRGRGLKPLSARAMMRRMWSEKLPEIYYPRAAQLHGIQLGKPISKKVLEKIHDLTFGEFLLQWLKYLLANSKDPKNIFELVNQMEGRPDQPISNPDGSLRPQVDLKKLSREQLLIFRQHTAALEELMKLCAVAEEDNNED